MFCDEIDKYGTNAEGDPVKLAEERTATYWNRKVVQVCSPTIKGSSPIEAAYLESDRRVAMPECPHCSERVVLKWEMVRWAKDEQDQHLPDTAAIYCSECGSEWTESDRLAALEGLADLPGYGWRQTAPFTCCGQEHEPSIWDGHGNSLCPTCGKRSEFDGHAGFWANALYSPWRPVSELVRKFLSAKRSGDAERLKTFVNTILAETWEEVGERVTISNFDARKEDYSPDDLPKDILVLTAGVDTQDDRLEVEVVGWGEGHRSWGVEYHVLFGDPGLPDVC